MSEFLYPYQVAAVKKMHNGCILNGGVGSGKSRTGLYYYFSQCGGRIDETYHKMTNPKDLYIITTAQKRDNKEWELELAHYLLSTHPELNSYKNIVIVDSWQNIKKYKKVIGAFFIFDEDHVTGKGTWVKSFYEIAKKNKWIILSATPGDTWEQYIPVFVANGFYRNRSDFTQQHIVWSPYTKYPKIQKYINTGTLIRHRNELLVDMPFDRHTVQHHTDVHVEYNIPLYKETFKNRWDPYHQRPFQNAAALCYTLRKIVNSDASRQIKLLEYLEDIDKAIIFYNFDYEREILMNLGYKPGTEIAEWSGWAHQEIPKSKYWVYLVNYNAGAEGWNCIETDTIIFYSQNYSYKLMLQAAGRIDRRNTLYKDLHYFHFKSFAPIDIAISRAQKEKKNFNESKWIHW